MTPPKPQTRVGARMYRALHKTAYHRLTKQAVELLAWAAHLILLIYELIRHKSG